MMTNNANKIGSEREILFKDLSYALIGAAFEVFNELGWGLSEKAYQAALEKELHRRSINFKREVYIPLDYKSERIGRYFADFVIEEKVLLELKVVSRLGYVHAKQVLGYLKSSKIKLGILLYFTREGVKYRRVINSSI
ncbi:MAG: GxxExxY protein [Patescibacteria group bacterium]